MLGQPARETLVHTIMAIYDDVTIMSINTKHYLTLSLPNATVVEFAVHCLLQSKFKGTVDICLF